ncbi:MAG: HDOD domain-containing protein [Fimbriimonadaceae bacterium]|nr:HDOD domain-containing protein [Fimbriimonadaceae bacterium]
MTERLAYERLQLLFKRTGTLPPLPTTVVKLIRTIDTGEASTLDVEKVVAGDPQLCVDLLRAANSAVAGGARTATIRSAIMRLGQRTVRSLAVSLLVNDVFKKYAGVHGFDPKLLARHSMFVGYMSRFLFARRNALEPFDSRWSADELFAAGVMHDLPVGLLAIVAPSAYGRVAGYAARARLSMADAFEVIFEHPIHPLGADACETWGLPEVFATTQRYLAEPWEHEQELTALYCLNYANYVAESNGFGLETWEFDPSVLPEALTEVGLQVEEVANAVQAVGQLATSAFEAGRAA